MEDKQDLTQLIKGWRRGDGGAQNKLDAVIYDTLRRVAGNQMRRERANHTLQATVLVNEAFIQLADAEISWSDSAHFRGVAAKIMRRTLIDYAREKNAAKRGGGVANLTLMESVVDGQDDGFDLLELDELLQRLAEFDERKAKVIELVFFGGLNYAEVGEVLGISKATVDRELRVGKSWLYKELSGTD